MNVKPRAPRLLAPLAILTSLLLVAACGGGSASKGRGEKCAQSSECVQGLVCSVNKICDFPLTDQITPPADGADGSADQLPPEDGANVDGIDDLAGGETLSDATTDDTGDSTTADGTGDLVDPDLQNPDAQGFSCASCVGLQGCDEGNKLCLNPTICLDDIDCVGQLICEDGECKTSRTGCTQDAHCTKGKCNPLSHECVDNDTLPQKPDGCVGADDCVGNHQCVDKICVECTDNAHCEYGATCDTGAKQCVTFTAPVADKCEANDSPGTAATLGVGECLSSADLTLPSGDVDWFTFTVNPGETLIVSVLTTNTYGAIQLELTDATGTFAWDIDNKGYHWARVSYWAPDTATKPQTILAKVSLRGTGDFVPSYKITSAKVTKAYCRPDTFETLSADSNNTQGTATQLVPAKGLFFPGLRICKGDVDYYKFVLETPPLGTNGFDISLNVVTDRPDRLKVVLLDDNGDVIDEALGTDSLQLIKQSMPAGAYYLRFSGAGTDGGPDPDVTVAYSMNVDIGTQNCIDYLELPTNNDAANATKVPNASQEYTFLRLCAFDEDWFRYDLGNNSDVNVRVEFDLGAALGVQLIDHDEKVLLTCTYATSAETGDCIGSVEKDAQNVDKHVLRASLPVAAAQIYARVFRTDPADSTHIDYKVSFTPSGTCTDDAFEDDDTRADAKPLSLSQDGWTPLSPRYAICVSTPGETTDWKKLAGLKSGDVVTLDALHFVSSGANALAIGVFDSTGAPVAGVQSFPGDDTMKKLGRSVSFVVPSDGDYFVELKNALTDVPYRLTTRVVSATDLPCAGTGIDNEPNNTPLSAGVLTGTDTTLNSNLTLCKGNDDWYALVNLPLSKYKLTLGGVQPGITDGTLKIVVYNSNWELLPDPPADLQAPNDYILTLPSSGTYIVGLRPTASFATNLTYSLKLTSPVQ